MGAHRGRGEAADDDDEALAMLAGGGDRGEDGGRERKAGGADAQARANGGGGGHDGAGGGCCDCARLAPLARRLPRFVRADPLLSFTLLGVAAGVSLGAALRAGDPSDETIELVGFLGELMLRSLKMVVAPLIAGSIVTGVTNLSSSGAGMGTLVWATLSFYALSTGAAVALGCACVALLRPGVGRSLPSEGCDRADDAVAEHAAEAAAAAATAAGGGGAEAAPGGPDSSPSFVQSLLDVCRGLVPENIFGAFSTNNVLGIITFSALFGAAVVALGERAGPVARGVDALNAVIERVVRWLVWCSPLGIASLVAAEVAGACDLSETAEALSMWVVCVLAGLAVHALVVLPALLLAVTRGKGKPKGALVGALPAMAAAFGTDSSTAALPVTIECARKSGGRDAVARFVCPLGAVVNMNGTALYEATTVLFIAQAHDEPLPPGRVLAIAITSTLAALGAATVPSAGVVTMLMVLQATGLGKYAADVAVILAVDWALDRCRTAVNVLGDVFATHAVSHAADRASRQHSRYAAAGGDGARDGGVQMVEL
eukprot:PRCOL_00005506-RA